MKLYHLVFVAVTLLSLGQLVIGAGYRTLGTIALKSAAAATLGAVVGGVIALVGFNPGRSGPYAEGLGIALLALLVIGAFLGWLIVFAGVFVALKRRHSGGLLERSARSRARMAIGILGLVPAIGIAFHAGYSQLPSLHSDAELLEQLLQSREREPNSLIELLRRGNAVVPVIVARFERGGSGETMGPVESIRLLELLGRLRGEESAAALRRYLGEGYPPYLRARAALVLGVDVHDSESAASIAKLLEYRGHEWRQYQPLVFESLASLEAKAQVPSIIAALELEPEFAGSNIEHSMVTAGSDSLARLGGAEAWKKLVALSEAAATRETTLRALYKIDRHESQQILVKALDDPSPDIKSRVCEALIEMPTLRPRLSYYSCPSPNEQSWELVAGDIRRAVAAGSE